MRMLKVELKRIIKSRQTIILTIAGICFSALLAVAPVLFVSVDVYDDNGNVQELNGISAIRYLRESKASSDGEVTPDKLKAALATYQEFIEMYGDPESDNFPVDVYREKISPIKDLLRLLPVTYSDFVDGNLIPRGLTDLDLDDLDSFYEACDTRLDNVIKVDRETESTKQKAASLYSKVDRPFELYAGYTRDAFDYLSLCILLLVIIGVVLSAPLSSENYESVADHILRCTKYGRGTLARTKVIANMLPSILIYVVGITIHLLISDLSFGTITLKTSVQALYDTISLPNLNLFQLQIVLALGGLLTLISVNSFTYYLSAKLERVAGTVCISLLAALAPLFISAAVGTNWVSSILPAGGIGLTNNLLMQLVDFRFLHLGSHSFWNPQVTMLFTIIWIPVFMTLAVWSYCKHQIK